MDITNNLEKITYAFVIIYAIFITFEWLYSIKKGDHFYSQNDVKVNITLGLISTVLRILLKGITVKFWLWCYSNSLFKIETSVWSVLLLILLNEFIFYWFHRFSHSNKYLWAIHVNHHSSSYFNYSTATRNAVLNVFLINIIWAVLPLIGFEPIICLSVQSLSFLLTFFQHTQYNLKFKYIGRIINTSQHHKLHHAKNTCYINKNFGNTLIIFDLLFKTFVKESEKPVFGITKKTNNNNLFEIIFHEWSDLIKEKLFLRTKT